MVVSGGAWAADHAMARVLDPVIQDAQTSVFVRAVVSLLGGPMHVELAFSTPEVPQYRVRLQPMTAQAVAHAVARAAETAAAMNEATTAQEVPR